MPRTSGDYTTINISRPTVKRLMDIGRKGQTYDDIINTVLDHWAETQEVKA